MNQTVSSLNRVTDDYEMKKKIISKVLNELALLDYDKTPPETGRNIQKLINETFGVSDPFKEIKILYNNFTLDIRNI